MFSRSPKRFTEFQYYAGDSCTANGKVKTTPTIVFGVVHSGGDWAALQTATEVPSDTTRLVSAPKAAEAHGRLQKEA